MAKKRKKNDVVGGFDALRAAQNAQREGVYPKPNPAPPEANEGEKAPVSPVASRIGKTTMPSRMEIICYACSASFEVVGKSTNTVCPKCRERLNLQDETIDDAWEGELCTAGTVTIAESGVVQGGSLTANNVVLKGMVSGGEVRASRCLKLHEHAAFHEQYLKSEDLHIMEGCSYTLPEGTHYRNVTVSGMLEGSLRLRAKLSILSGGLFKGVLETGHLSVEAGGGLIADCLVDPTAPTANAAEEPE